MLLCVECPKRGIHDLMSASLFFFFFVFFCLNIFISLLQLYKQTYIYVKHTYMSLFYFHLFIIIIIFFFFFLGGVGGGGN